MDIKQHKSCITKCEPGPDDQDLILVTKETSKTHTYSALACQEQ